MLFGVLDSAANSVGNIDIISCHLAFPSHMICIYWRSLISGTLCLFGAFWGFWRSAFRGSPFPLDWLGEVRVRTSCTIQTEAVPARRSEHRRIDYHLMHQGTTQMSCLFIVLLWAVSCFFCWFLLGFVLLSFLILLGLPPLLFRLFLLFVGVGLSSFCLFLALCICPQIGQVHKLLLSVCFLCGCVVFFLFRYVGTQVSEMMQNGLVTLVAPSSWSYFSLLLAPSSGSLCRSLLSLAVLLVVVGW